MRRFLIILGIVVVALAVFVYVMLTSTKSHSPEGTASYSNGDLNVAVLYNRPQKKGRAIFAKDGLVPFGKVWRTGANEATVFETTKDLSFDGKILRKGKYSLWTVPDEQSWAVIFNSDIPWWGMGFDGQTQRVPEADVLKITAPVMLQEKEFEQFTIAVEKTGEEMQLIFMWDKTLVAVPFSLK